MILGTKLEGGLAAQTEIFLKKNICVRIETCEIQTTALRQLKSKATRKIKRIIDFFRIVLNKRNQRNSPKSVHSPSHSRRPKTLALMGTTYILAASLFLSACGSDDNSSITTSSGTITIDGSSTVFPITEAVAEEYRSINPNTRVVIGVSGTGGGFKKFCAGETDISNASRPIKDTEVKLCANAGIEYTEILVGLDGLVIVTSSTNDFLSEGITREQLKTIFEPDAEEKITRWNQVNPAWPDSEIEIFAPDTDSGTFDFFTEEINGDEGLSRADYTASSDDNVLVIGISGGKSTIGYFGYAYYTENTDRLKVLAVDGVLPSDATVADGSYSLARPLFIYAKNSALIEKDYVQDFIRYHLSDEAKYLIREAGYTIPSSKQRTDAQHAFEDALGGHSH